MSSNATVVAVCQAWIAAIADDPEASSALAVARARLDAGRRLEGLRRLRLIEIGGAEVAPARLAELLHRSTQFYNPHKERCTLRCEAGDPAPVGSGAWLVLVWERGGTRRPAAERWWRHETGQTVDVHEAVVWEMRFEPGAGAERAVVGLGLLRSAGEGLFCNPWSQEMRIAGARVPLPWLERGDGEGGEDP